MSYVKNDDIVETKQGRYYLGGRTNVIEQSLRNSKNWELELMTKSFDLLRKIDAIPSMPTVLDVGAHIGVTSIGLMVKKEIKKAIAVEPEAKNFSLLKANVSLNGFQDSISCVNAAASNVDGTATLSLNNNNSGDNRIDGSKDWEGQKVNCYTLETIINDSPKEFSDVSVVWIDVQGHENHVFQGSKELLKNTPVVSEVWGGGLAKAGVTASQFCETVQGIWKNFWRYENAEFIGYPIDKFSVLGGASMVIFA